MNPIGRCFRIRFRPSSGLSFAVALEKDPRKRVRDIGDVNLALGGVFEPSRDQRSETAASQGDGSRWSYVTAALLVGVLVGAAAVGLLYRGGASSAPVGVARFSIPMPPGVNLSRYGGLALSPDGQSLVFGTAERGRIDGQLYRRDMGALELSHVLVGAGRVQAPFFSPDGQWVGFNRAGEVYKLPLEGGLAVPLSPSAWASPAWGADDMIYFRLPGSRGLARMPAAGGDAVPFAESDLGVLTWPDVLPDASAVVFSTYPEDFEDAQIEVQSISTGERKTLVRGTAPRVTASGHLVFARNDSLWAAASTRRAWSLQVSRCQ